VNLVVTDSQFGAVADGSTDNTAAFRGAIEACSAAGGGHMVVPAGVYSTGAIHLLSNVDLHLEVGAVLRFNGNVRNYPLVLTRVAGIECMNYSPMIYAYEQTNIALTGAGVLDASRTRSWNVGTDFTGILEPLVAAGVPPEKRIVPGRGQAQVFIRPALPLHQRADSRGNAEPGSVLAAPPHPLPECDRRWRHHRRDGCNQYGWLQP
jgi:hypothetical protein